VYTLASDSIAMHRFQISVFGSIAIVFAVIGVNNGIFSGRPVLDAMSAGWLILAMVDIIWVLYFTSEEDSLMLHIFNSMGTGGLTPPSRRRTRRATPSVHMSANNGYATSYGGGGIGNDMTYGTKMGSGIGSGIGSGMGMGIGGGAPGSQRSFGQPAADQRSLGGGSINNMGGSTVGGGGPGSISNVDTNGPNSPLMNAGSPGDNAPTGENYSYKAKALYACKSNLRIAAYV
jgi:SHO1 osmosensor